MKGSLLYVLGSREHHSQLTEEAHPFETDT